MMEIKILKIKKRFFLKDKVLIKALADCKRTYGTFFGDKCFYLKKGNEISIKINAKDLKEGGWATFKIVCNENTADQFPWYFVE